MHRGTLMPVRSSPWLLAATAGALLFAADLAGFETHATAAEDRSVDLALHHTFGPASYHVFELITTMGGSFVRIPVIVLLVLGLVITRHWWLAMLTVVATGGAAILFQVIKLLVQRPRPHLFAHAVHADGFSFPSGHATDTFAFALVTVVLAWYLSQRRALTVLVALLFVIYVLLVGLSRVVLGVHYPTDVIGGYCLGTAWVAATVAILARGLDAERARAELRPSRVME